jgi:hypothetical protein
MKTDIESGSCNIKSNLNNFQSDRSIELNDIETESKDDTNKKKENKGIAYKRNYGKYKCFIFYNNDPIIAIGPDWPYFIVLSAIIFISFYVIFIYAGNKLEEVYRIIGIFVYLAQFCSYTFAALINPGIPSNNYYIDLEKNPEHISVKYQKCSFCHSLINLENYNITYHCSDCQMCIENFDHHCPWTSKCIGNGNLKVFYMFVGSTLAYIIYCLLAAFNLKTK